MKCAFRTVHTGIYSSQKINFECEEPALPKKTFCMFHDDSYYKDNVDQIKDTLSKKIKNHILNKKDLFCIGYNISSIIIKETFHIQICFNQSKFHGDLKIESIFYNNVSFQECQFEGNVSASYSIFYNFVNLSSSHFNKIFGLEKTEFDDIECRYTEFNDAYFPDVKFFSLATFHQSKLKNLHLSNAQFLGGVHFSNCKISGFVNLSCLFCEETKFTYTKFDPEKSFGIYFGKANFEGKSEFIHNEFSNVCYFNEVNFQNIINFKDCIFYDINFDKSIFHTDSYFSNCKFLNNSYFRNTSFQNVEFKKSSFYLADFTSANIQILGDFSEVEFKEVNFIETIFKKSSFVNSKFNKAIFKSSQFLDISNFNFVNFIDPTSFIFDNMNLSNVSFLNSDITRIRFNNITWVHKKDNYKIVEERLLNEKIHSNSEELNSSLEDILSIYRNLRENYEYGLRYDEAGEFFIREMELKRNYREKNGKIMENCWFRRNFSYSGIYRNISKYGESISKPIILLVSLIIGSTLIWYFYLFYTNINFNEEIPFIFYNSTLSVQALKITLSDIFQVNEHSTIIDYLIRILSIFLLGVLFIALRRKFERKFRH